VSRNNLKANDLEKDDMGGVQILILAYDAASLGDRKRGVRTRDGIAGDLI